MKFYRSRTSTFSQSAIQRDVGIEVRRRRPTLVGILDLLSQLTIGLGLLLLRL
jgi:hypothetical protein